MQPLRVSLSRARVCSVSADLPRFDPKDFLEKPVNVWFLPLPVIKQSGSFKALLDFLARRLSVRLALAGADDRPFGWHTGSLAQDFRMA